MMSRVWRGTGRFHVRTQQALLVTLAHGYHHERKLNYQGECAP
jgi:hypothetical protein